MSIDRALSKKVQYEVKETYLSDFDFSEFSISEDDKEKLLEKEELIRNTGSLIKIRKAISAIQPFTYHHGMS